ncbi:NAD(P)/FAD-dependent oxidoreductase [Streptomyces sp. NPDC094472]|uniref:phytoene desaturase family protein n=1 Tax=unclassified Streptomyces TaxID=2593676 RepID=UPI003317BB6C
MAEADAVIVGSGVNGLVAAAELALAGWSVVLVEREPNIGGFIATEERTLPGYLHDTYSSWHPLFVSGPAYARLGELLRRHGLEYRNTDEWVTASVADDGRVTLAHRDPRHTTEGFAHDEDRAAYVAGVGRLGDNMEAIGGLMSSELRSPALLRHAATLLRGGGRHGAERWVRSVATSGRGYTRTEFRGDEVDHLFAPWLLHAGLSPDHASGGFLMPLLAASLHGFGLPVVAGGASRFLDAFRSLLTTTGVRVEAGTRVDRILVERGRAVGVAAGGRVIRARGAVLASVTPTALCGTLLPEGAVKPELRDEARRFWYGRAAMQIHVALSQPLGWRDTRLNTIPLVHLSDGFGQHRYRLRRGRGGPAAPAAHGGRRAAVPPGPRPGAARGRRAVAAVAGGAVHPARRLGR